MAEAKLAPNLPDWMVEHVNRYLAGVGAEGHMYYKRNVPGRGEITRRRRC
jgi:proline iminopeptidase